MKRFVTYIYEYERGMKGKNTGFIKADIRGNDCRMEIHLRGLNGIRGKGKVYVLVKEENFIGIEIGEIMLNGGKGDFRIVFRVNPIQDTAYTFADIMGVCVAYGGGQMSASQWRGEEPIPFTVSDIQIWEKQPAKDVEDRAESQPASMFASDTDLQTADTDALNVIGRQTEAAAVEEPEKQTEAAAVKEAGRQAEAAAVREPEKQTEAAAVKEAGRQAEAAAVRETEKQIDAAAVKEAGRQTEAAAAEEPEKQTEAAAVRESGQRTDVVEAGEPENQAGIEAAEEQELPFRTTENTSKADPVSDPVLEAHAAVRTKNIFPDNASLGSKWEELQANHQAVSLASEVQGNWIRMEIKELRDLPKRFWYLGNNSFLLHGFFNYHHILFGKEESEQGTMWYLGVPGVFQKEERVMATLFGFSRFCPLTGKPSEGGFGYWMYSLEKG